MGMLGNQLAAGQALTVANDSFNGDGSTTAFTLSQTVSSVNDIEVLVDNVQQSPYDGSYSVSGTTLTFSGAPSAGTNNVYVIYNASKHITTSQVIPDDGSVTHSKLHTNATLPITRDMTNNRVGINHTSPEQHLHVNSATNTRALIETTNAGSVAELQLKNTAQTVKLGIETSSDAGGGAYGGAGASDFAIVNGTNTGLSIDTSGRIKHPNQPHIFGSPVNSGGAGIANRFDIGSYSRGTLSFSNNRITVPVAGLYLITYMTICDTQTGRIDTHVKINGSNVQNGLSNTNAAGYQQRTHTLVVNLAANDYIQFDNDDWYDRTGTVFNDWRTASVTLIG